MLGWIFGKSKKQEFKRARTYVCKHCKHTCEGCDTMFCYSCYSNPGNPCPKCGKTNLSQTEDKKIT